MPFGTTGVSRIYKLTIRAKTEAARTPETANTLVVSMSEAVLPAAAEPEAEPEPDPDDVDRACTPKVVPVMTDA